MLRRDNDTDKSEDLFSLQRQMAPQGEEHNRVVNREQLKDLILQFRDQKQQGYYTFKSWGKLHSQLFGIDPEPLPQTVLNLWRILKLINFGDDYIPTGLIYDTLVTLMLMAAQMKTEAEKTKALEEVQGLLKSIFFKFIQFNGKYLAEDQKDELAFFKVIRPVAEGYRKIIVSNFYNQQKGTDKTNLYKMSRNQQLYKMHDVFVYKKNLQKLKKIQQQFKQCTFQPDMSYTSRTITAQSRYLQPIKANKSNGFSNSHLIKDPEYIIHEQQLQQQKLFKANPVPSYPQVNPIGVNEHLERMQRSRQIKRINELRVYSSVNSNSKLVKQFSIDERDRERKQKMLNSYKILFNIKVEVAKRIYRVKVRQNMGISDVVRAIELMVGFKHPQVEEIVKGYFINWEMRKSNNNKFAKIQQYSYEQQQR